MVNRKCDCCNKQYDAWNRNQKLCYSCRTYVHKMQKEVIRYRAEVKRLKLKLYGQVNGSQRIRFKDDKNK